MSVVAKSKTESSVNKGPWQSVKLGDIAEFIMGQAPPGDASNFEGRGTIFVKAGEFGPSHPLIREWTTKPLRYAKSGDVLICVVGATAGKLNLGIDCAIGRSVAAIRPNSQINDRFLYLQLLPKVLTLRAGSTGSAQGVINRGMLFDIDIVLPPLPEQRRIVAEIEKQFSRLEEGVGALRRVQANLKRYRAAVLKAACEGQLVPTEAELCKRTVGRGQRSRKTFESGEELLARILAERRKNWQGRGKYKEPAAPDTSKLGKLPEGWAVACVGHILKVRNGYAFKSSDYCEIGIPLVRQADLVGRWVSIAEAKRLPPSCLEECAEYTVRKGNMLIGMSGVLGKISEYREDIPALQNQRTGLLLINKNIPAAFSKLVLQYVERQIVSEGKGIAVQNVSAAEIEGCVFMLPPLAEQSRIVAEVERRLSVVEEMEATVEANLQRATRLRQSILQKAFEGNI